MRFSLALPLLLLMSGCTTRAWYEGFKMGAENECYKQPPGAVADCLSRLNKKTHHVFCPLTHTEKIAQQGYFAARFCSNQAAPV